MTAIDIRPADLETVRLILREHVPAVEVRDFGSRVAWNARETSDLDLALMTDEPLTVAQMADLRAAFTGADLPFRVDIVDWASTSEAFRRVVESEHAVLVDGREDHQGGARPVRSVEDVCLRVTSGGTPSRRQPLFYEDGCWPWLKTQELRDGWLDDSEEYITDDAVASSSAKVLPENTVLMAMYGATVGQLGILRCPMTCNQACCAMIVDPGRADYRYLFYQLLHARPRIRNLSTGAAQQNLSGQLIKSLKFPFPPLTDQRAIAHILGTLDDKIELNRRMNATLEAMARALFRSWFVDFDPVRAKMEGRDTGLPKEIADLFPDRLVDSELGEIPEGWTVSELGDMIELAYGKALKAESRNAAGGVPVFGSNGQIGWHDEALVQRPGIVVGRKGNPGTVTLSSAGFFPIDTTFYVLPKHERHECLYFLFFALQAQDLPSVAADSAVPGLNRNLAYMNKQLRPPTSVVACFDGYVGAMYARRREASAESRVLVSLRDSLLPRLVSGELRVSGLKPASGRDDRPAPVASHGA